MLGRLNWTWPLFLVLLILFVGARSVGPRIAEADQQKFCAVNVHVTKILGASLNCDSPEFMRLSADPAALLEPNNALQAKPGMIVVAGAIAAVIRPVSKIIPYFITKAERPDIDPARIAYAIHNFGAAFVAYFVLNILALMGSFWLLLRISGHGEHRDFASAAIIVAVSGLLILTYPVTNWLLTPHTQILNTFVPLLTLYVVMRILRAEPMVDRRFFATAGLITGFGILAYGLFYLLIPFVIATSVLQCWRKKTARFTLISNLGLYLFLSIAPIVCWSAYVRLATGQFHYREVENFDSVVWMIKAARGGVSTLIAQTADRIRFHGGGFLYLAKMTAIFALLLAGFVLIYFKGRFDAVKSAWAKSHETLVACLCVSFFSLLFYIVVGQYQVRHSYAALPPLVGAVGIATVAIRDIAPPPARKVLATLCGLFLVVSFYLGATAGVDYFGKQFD